MLARNHTILGIYRIYSISQKRAITDFKQEEEEKSYSVAPLFLFWSLNSLVLWKTIGRDEKINQTAENCLFITVMSA